MALQFSQRIQSVQSPIIPIVGEWTRASPGTISLGQGVVAYGPPSEAIERIQYFADNADNHLYGPAQGIPELQLKIEQKLCVDNSIDCHQQGYKIVVTAGSNMAFLNAVLAITDPDDEIILLLPYYFNQEMAITLINCKVVTVPTDNLYQPDLPAIKRAISEKTRAIVTVSPNNPSGAVYSRESLLAINNLCLQHNIYHISDEAYEYFTYHGTQHYSPGAFDSAGQHTISLFSLSKAYGFASWRIGYIVIPEVLYPAILKIQDTNLICPPLISQYAAIGALQSGADYCRNKLLDISQCRTAVIDQLMGATDLFETVYTDGAFYFLLKINTEMNDVTLVKKLISDFKVAAIPGSAFGLSDSCYLRISYGKLTGASAETGIKRIINGLRTLC